MEKLTPRERQGVMSLPTLERIERIERIPTREQVVNSIGISIRQNFSYDVDRRVFDDPVLKLWYYVILRAVDDYLGGNRYAANTGEAVKIKERAFVFLQGKQVEDFGIDGEWFFNYVESERARWKLG